MPAPGFNRMTLELFRNRVNVVNLPIIEASDEADAQAETFAAGAVTLGENAEAFDGADDVFNRNARAGALAVGAFLVLGQRFVFAFLGRHGGIGMLHLKALIAGIETGFGPRLQANTGQRQQFVVVDASLRCGMDADDFTAFLVNDQLRLQRVPLFLSRVATPLFFFGRSTGVSVALMRTPSHSMPGSSKAFLPGNRKTRLWIKAFSIQRMVFQQTLSDTP